jgi:hypothetical protein
MAWLRLAPRQPALLAFLVFRTMVCAVLTAFAASSAAYFWIYVATVVGGWFFSAAAVREMFSLMLVAYPGLRSAGRWAMYGALITASLASLLLAAAFWGGPTGHQSKLLFYLDFLDRSIVFSLAVVIVSLLLFQSHYPLGLHRNTYTSSGFFSAIFLSLAAQLLVDSLMPDLYSRFADIAQLAFASLCLVAWAVMLRREEVRPQRITFQSPEEHELLRQLESMNRMLTRAGRR